LDCQFKNITTLIEKKRQKVISLYQPEVSAKIAVNNNRNHAGNNQRRTQDRGGGATRPLPREWGMKELHGDPTVGHAPRSKPEVKNGRSCAKDGAPERLECGTVKEEVSRILQRVSAGAA